MAKVKIVFCVLALLTFACKTLTGWPTPTGTHAPTLAEPTCSPTPSVPAPIATTADTAGSVASTAESGAGIRITATLTPSPTTAPGETLRLWTPLPEGTPSPTPQACRVLTGVPVGWLNLRACPGLSCAVIGELQEGQTLILQPNTPPAGAWLAVEAGSLAGWVNSSYTDCEVIYER